MKPDRILLFEDTAVADLDPVASSRPAFELRYGLENLRERAERVAGPAAVCAHVRESLRGLLEETLPGLAESPADGETLLLVNARALLSTEDLRQWFEAEGEEGAWRDAGADLAVARLDAHRGRAYLEGEDDLSELAEIEGPELRLAEGLWNHVHRNGAALCEDFREWQRDGLRPRRIFGVSFADETRAELLDSTEAGGLERAAIHPGVHVLAEENLLLGEGAVIEPGVVLDARRGPVVVGVGAVIHPLSVVVGPAYVGPGSTVNPGARLREGTNVGAFCKVGGEIEEAVLLDLCNKQHDGFLGHAYLGHWVNLGADTNGSDLKNNYSAVRVDLGRGVVDTGERFVGPLIGDHVKTGINTMLNTGTVLGAGANVFGAGFPPKFVPPFSWGGAEGLIETRREAMLETAAVVLSRRGVRWTPRYQEMLERLFEDTAGARAEL